jgi:hypothetical protein
MLLLLLFLTLSAVYCFAVLRWTRRLPVGWRRLVRTMLLCFLFPALVVQGEYSVLVPRTFFYSLYWGDLNLYGIKRLLIQTSVLCGVVYGLWMAWIGLYRPQSGASIGLNRVKLAAIICALPSWVLVAGTMLYRFGLEGRHWPHFDLLGIPLLVCLVCSLAAMTLFLIAMSDYLVSRVHILLLVWSAFPVCLAMLLGGLLWFFITFGNTTMEDIYGY